MENTIWKRAPISFRQQLKVGHTDNMVCSTHGNKYTKLVSNIGVSQDIPLGTNLFISFPDQVMYEYNNEITKTHVSIDKIKIKKRPRRRKLNRLIRRSKNMNTI